MFRSSGPSVVIIVMLGVWPIAVWPTPLLAAGNAPRELSRGSVVVWLRHQEQLVETMYAEFTIRHSATDTAVIPLIRKICAQRGNEADYISYVVTDEVAASRDTRTRWWRKGTFERFEVAALSAAPNGRIRVKVYDGTTVRQLNESGQARTALVDSPDRLWYATNEIDGFSILHDFNNTPYSDLVERAPVFSVEPGEDGQQWRVTFQHPYSESRRFTLIFDKQGVLRKRLVYFQLSRDAEQRLYHSTEFDNYSDFDHPSGETIVFPQRVVNRHFVGHSSDGLLAEYLTKTIDFEDVQFNVPISNETFTLEFPAGTRIIDHSAGAHDVVAYTEGAAPGSRPAIVRLFIGVNALLLLLLAAWWHLHRRRHAAMCAGLLVFAC